MRRWIVAVLLSVVLAPPVSARRSDERPLTLLFAGDVMLSRYVDRVIERQQDPILPWRLVARRTRRADLFFVNLEAPFSKRGPYDNDDLVFAVRPSRIKGLVAAGVDVVSTANNHFRDVGEAGVQLTRDLLQQFGIRSTFPGRPAVVKRRGLAIGIVSSSYNLGLDIKQLATDIRRVQRRGVTYIVATMHAGTEYASTPNPQQNAFARAAIDQGADLVVGHHPHVPQTVERYRGKTIVYSLGNFIFDQFWSDATRRGQVLEVRLEHSGRYTTKLHDISINRQAQPAFIVR